MKLKTIIFRKEMFECDNCGTCFEDQHDCEEHEKHCCKNMTSNQFVKIACNIFATSPKPQYSTMGD